MSKAPICDFILLFHWVNLFYYTELLETWVFKSLLLMKSCSQVMNSFYLPEILQRHWTSLPAGSAKCMQQYSTVQYSIDAVILDSNPITTPILALPTPVPDNVMLADTQMMMWWRFSCKCASSWFCLLHSYIKQEWVTNKLAGCCSWRVCAAAACESSFFCCLLSLV